MQKSAKDVSFTPVELAVLTILFENDSGLRNIDIAQKSGRNKGNLSRVLKRLSERRVLEFINYGEVETYHLRKDSLLVKLYLPLIRYLSEPAG